MKPAADAYAAVDRAVIPGEADPAAVGAADFRHLPPRIPFEAMTTGQPATDPPSPYLGHDPDHEWLLRMGAG